MRTFLMSLAVCMAVAASIWMSAGHSAFSTPAASEPTASSSKSNQITTALFSNTVVNSVAAVMPAPMTAPMTATVPVATHTDPHDLQDHDEAAHGPEIKFDSLPDEMQQEITQLSGRDVANIVVNEVSPGVFLMSKGPRVVPVAVMNEDGTVSVHEY